jgi:hypothetical protein
LTKNASVSAIGVATNDNGGDDDFVGTLPPLLTDKSYQDPQPLSLYYLETVWVLQYPVQL